MGLLSATKVRIIGEWKKLVFLINFGLMSMATNENLPLPSPLQVEYLYVEAAP
jgi:hypothetical protein